MVALRLTGRVGAAARAAVDVVHRADELTPDQREQVVDVLPALYSQAGTTLLYAGRWPEAVEAFDRGLASATTPFEQLPNLALLVGTLALDGAMDRAEPLTRRVRAGIWPPGMLEGYSGTLYHVAEALAALEEFDSAGAQRRLDVLGPHLSTIEHWPLIAQVQAMVDLLHLGPEGALARFDATVRSHAGRQPAHRPSAAGLEATRATLLVAAGRPLAAIEALPRTPDDPARLVALARARLHAGRPGEALAALSAKGLAGRSSIRVDVDAALVAALALAASGRPDDAAGDLARAEALTAVHRVRLPLALLSAEDRATLADLAERHRSTELAAALARAGATSVASPRPLPPLTPREAVVLHALTRTGSAAEIAEALVVSSNTVKSQLRSLYRKLGVASREEALETARRTGLLSAQDVPALE